MKVQVDATVAGFLRVVDRPFFCRVEPKVFDEFFGVPRSKFDKEACRFARVFVHVSAC